MLNYTCPRCGSLMQIISTASIPPIITYTCFQCGYASRPVHETEHFQVLPEFLWPENGDKEANPDG